MDATAVAPSFVPDTIIYNIFVENNDVKFGIYDADAAGLRYDGDGTSDGGNDAGDARRDGSSSSSSSCLPSRSVMQPGSDLLAAGYCLYSSTTMLVFTLGGGTHGFTLDTATNEFVLTHPNMRIPNRGNIYSCNESYVDGWDGRFREYLSAIKNGRGVTGRRYTQRYIGSMVGDVSDKSRTGSRRHRRLVFVFVPSFVGRDIASHSSPTAPRCLRH
jgi:hypothetical protein